MAMSALSVVFSVFVLTFHHKRSGSNPPPNWIKFIATIASVLTCTKLSLNSDACQPSKGSVRVQRDENMTEYNLINANEEEQTDTCGQLLDKNNTSQCTESHVTNKSSNNSVNGSGHHVPLPEHVVADYIIRVLSGYGRPREEIKIVNDWREIARVLDRVLFLIFGFITFTSTFTLLVICPFTKSITIKERLDV